MLTPGYYAVSSTLLYGLKWRLYARSRRRSPPEAWVLNWNAHEPDAFGYFREFTPIQDHRALDLIYRLGARGHRALPRSLRVR